MPSITQKPIGRGCSFMDQLYDPLWFVVHFTGGTPNLQSLYNYWLSQCGVGSNSHFGIERYSTSNSQPGDIWQFLDYTRDGACANCCLENGHAPFLPSGVNLNVRTISVECINADTGNLGAMPQAQFDSLVYLIKKVCTDMNIPTNILTRYNNGYEDTTTWGNANGGIIMHRDIAPINRRMCPGDPYYNGQMQAVINAVNGGNMANVFVPPKKDQYIIDSWEEFSRATGQPIPQRDRGIFTEWRNAILNNNVYIGSPTTDEIIWDANWIVERFTAGSIWWNRQHYEVHIITGGGPYQP